MFQFSMKTTWLRPVRDPMRGRIGRRQWRLISNGLRRSDLGTDAKVRPLRTRRFAIRGSEEPSGYRRGALFIPNS